MWKFDIIAITWVYSNGQNIPNQGAVGAAATTYADTNSPGSRSSATTVLRTSDSTELIFFGGYGYDSAATLEMYGPIMP
jgi:hypothetical protein